MRSASTRPSPRRLGAALAVIIAAGTSLLPAACGGDETEGDVEALLDRAFRKPLRSADVDIDAQLAVQGLTGFERPVRLQASGAYIGVDRALPKLDIDLNIGAQGAGQTVQSGLLSTSDRAFVKFGGAFYEQPREDVAHANRRLRSEGGGESGPLHDLGLDPRRWVVDAQDEGEETVAGIETQHLSAKLDTRRLFRDLNAFVERSAAAVGGPDADVPKPLSPPEVDRLAEIVRSPSFDVYVGKADDVVRRLSASLELRVPEADRHQFGGIESGSLRFSLELGDVNGDQRVDAPADARPIRDLTRQLGGLGALGAAGGQRDERGREDGRDGTEALRRYSECLDRAQPDNTKALTRCAELLR